MDAAKIRLSPEEMELVSNAGWILTKTRIQQKVQLLFGQLQQDYAHYLDQLPVKLPPAVFAASAKISKGENYKGLPYLILDYPRQFGQEDVFAIRTMFWWGHFFSLTLHLSGEYKKNYKNRIVAAHSLLKNDFYCCINNDPWLHDFEKINYQPVAAFSEDDFKKLLEERSFIKLATKIELPHWDKAVPVLQDAFELLTGILTG